MCIEWDYRRFRLNLWIFESLNLILGLFRVIIDEWKSLPEETKKKYIEMSEKLKVEYLKNMEQWTDKVNKSGKAEDLEKANEKLKSLKHKKKSLIWIFQNFLCHLNRHYFLNLFCILLIRRKMFTGKIKFKTANRVIKVKSSN